MGSKRNEKLLAILALCVAVVGLTLGFAAFSNTLTIQSSATVTPDKSDFKMKIYGLNDASKFSNEADWDAIMKDSNYSDPVLRNTAKASKATIDNGTLTIKKLDAGFTNPGDIVDYYFKVVNEGKYTAYLTLEDVLKINDISLSKVCTADPETTESLVNSACGGIDLSAYVMGSDTWLVLDSTGGASEPFLEIVPNDYIYMIITIDYGNNAVRADGNFSVDFDDIKLNFSTVEPEV